MLRDDNESDIKDVKGRERVGARFLWSKSTNESKSDINSFCCYEDVSDLTYRICLSGTKGGYWGKEIEGEGEAMVTSADALDRRRWEDELGFVRDRGFFAGGEGGGGRSHSSSSWRATSGSTSVPSLETLTCRP